MDAGADGTYRPRPQPRLRVRTIEPEYATDGEGADTGGRVWTGAVAITILGAVLGALIGLLVTATQAQTFQATTSLSVLPDPDLDTDDSTPAVTQDATAFVQSQLVVLNGAQLGERVRAETGVASSSSVEATQVGQTYVVSVVATARSTADALAIAQRTATDYDTIRTGQLTTRIDRLLASTDQQLATVRRSLTNADDDNSADAPTPSQTALQSEFERLLSQRSSLAGVRAGVGDVVSVVAPPRETSAGLGAGARNALLGALIGAIVGLAAFTVARRSVRRIRTVGDLASLGLPVLLPVQSGRPIRRQGELLRPDPPARLLAARLDPELTTGDPVAFVGTSPDAGADRLSIAVAAALTDRGPVLYLPRTAAGPNGGLPWLPPLAGRDLDAEGFAALMTSSDVPGVFCPVGPPPGDADAPPPTRVSRTAHLAGVFRQARRHGYLVVVEPDPVTDTDLAVDCGRAGASILLVTARDATPPADVLVASELFAAQSVTLLGAVLAEPRGPVRRVVAQMQAALVARRTKSAVTSVDDTPPDDATTDSVVAADETTDAVAAEETADADTADETTDAVAPDETADAVAPDETADADPVGETAIDVDGHTGTGSELTFGPDTDTDSAVAPDIDGPDDAAPETSDDSAADDTRFDDMLDGPARTDRIPADREAAAEDAEDETAIVEITVPRLRGRWGR